MLTRRNQLQIALQNDETTAATALNTDAFNGLDLQTNPERNMIERREATSSLGHKESAIGRGGFKATFGLDLKGRGTKARPEFSRPLLMAGMRELAIQQLTLTTLAGTNTFYVGETVTQPNAGDQVAIGRVVKVNAAEASIWVASHGQKPFRVHATDLITGFTSGRTAVVTVIAAQANNFCYIPWSKRAYKLFLTGALTGPPPVGDLDGYACLITRAGVKIAGGTVRRYDYTVSPQLDLYIDILWQNQTILIGDAVSVKQTGGADHTGVVFDAGSAAAGWIPPGTIRANVDGSLRQGIGCRGTWRLAGQVGETGQFEMEFSGRIGTVGDAGLMSNLVYQSDGSPIRISGANFTIDTAPYGAVNNGLKLPYASFEINVNNTVVMRPDGNDPEGDLSAMIVDRDPVISIDPDMVPTTSLDWHAAWVNRTLLTFSATLGTGAQTILLHAMKCQVHSVTFSDRDQVLVSNVQLKPRVVHGDGDDEFMLVAFSS